jgi:iron-sulfur cluster repair protein YtfE (RIC family)
VDALGDEMEAHMRRAESAFFPLCRRLDRAGAAGAPDTGTAHCRGLVEAAVRLMAAEDDDAREALDALRALTNDFAPPADACDSYRALLRGFRELDADLRRHLDEEKALSVSPRSGRGTPPLPQRKRRTHDRLSVVVKRIFSCFRIVHGSDDENR